MIYPLHIFNNEIYEKQVYIWGCNVSAVYIFRKLMPYEISICGFISDEEKYIGDFIANIKIVDINDVIKESSIIMIDDANPDKNEELRIKGFTVKTIERRYLFQIMTGEKSYSLCNNGLLNPLLRERKIYVYGCGYGAEVLVKELKNVGINIQGFCTTEEPSIDSKLGYQVRKYEENDYNTDKAIIVSAVRRDYQEQILDKLSSSKADVFVDELVSVKMENRFIEQIAYAIKMHKDIYLCVPAGFRLDFLKRYFEKYEIKISGMVYLNEDLTNNIKDIYSLSYLDIHNTSVVTWEYDEKKQWEILSILYEIGYSNSDNSIIGMYYIQQSANVFLGRTFFIQDALVDMTTRYYSSDIVGWRILGDNKKNKIMILGGSTSSYDIYPVESWGEKLYKKIKNNGLEYEVFIGACPGDSVVTEFLRLIRDIDVINPSIVISMSGVNDIKKSIKGRGFNHDFKYEMLKSQKKAFGMGMRSEKEYFDFWIEIESLMNMYVQKNDAIMYSILQPCNIYMDKMNLFEKLQFDSDNYREGAKDFCLKAENCNKIVNLWTLFHHKEGMYLDEFHYSDEANRILADEVYEIIMPSICV